MQRPEYFVIRVYRRAPDDPMRIEGVVEVVANATQHAFASAEALWAILQKVSLPQDRTRRE
jgi:hypothetical protein